MNYRKRKTQSKTSYERLEGRQLLAGDVLASVDGGTLVIQGDSQSNIIQLTQDGGGNVLITGNDTTVNGQSQSISISEQFSRVSIRMGDGADELSVFDFEGGREFRFLGEGGNDRLTTDNLSSRYMHLRGGSGDDVFELTQSRSRKSTYVFLEEGNDVLAVPSFVAGRNFKVYGGNGNDTFASSALSVARKFRVNLGSGNDQALLAGSTTVGKSAKFRLGSGDDLLAVVPELTNETSFFRRRVVVTAGSGDDTVAFDAGVTLRKPSRIVGQSGSDSIDSDDANINRHTRIRGFENSTVLDLADRIDEVFDTLSNAGIDAEIFGDTDVTAESTLQLTVAQTPLDFTENAPSIAIDSNLLLTADGDEQVAFATVQVSGGSDGEDSLLFDDTTAISGNFESTTGILSLTGSASPADYQLALRGVRFENSSDNPTTDDRTVTISVQSELPVTPTTASRTIQVAAVDDLLSLSLPGQFGSQTPINFNAGEVISFTAEGLDLDNSFVYQLDTDESGISATAEQPSIDSETGIFTWNPTETGAFPIRVIVVNDIGDADQEQFTIVVG